MKIPSAHMAARPIAQSWWSAILTALLLVFNGGALAIAGETNALPASPVPTVPRLAPSHSELAAAYEHAGRQREVAALYEAMARTNSAARKVLSHRLVTLYSELGETNQALTWAHEVMRDNPDPQAYLAAVQARLGQFNEAEKILEKEIAANTNTTRAITLRWQLADVCEAQGERAKAAKIMGEASDKAKGTPMETTARRRVDALEQSAK